MRGRKTSWSVVRAVMVALNGGATVEEAAGLVGVNRSTVSRLIAEHGRMNLSESKPRANALTAAEREDIHVGICAGLCDAEIGRRVGRPRGTIGREIRRNGGRENYRPHRAEERAVVAASRAQKGWTAARPWLWAEVQNRLRDDWSPKQISATLKREHPGEPDWWVSHESIYQAIYVQAKGTLKAELTRCLRTQRDRRKPRTTRGRSAGSPIKDMVNISLRPHEVEDRAVPGHWEGDLILGKGGQCAIATIVERSTRFGFMVQLDSKRAPHVAQRLAEEASRIPGHLLKSLTWDQGTEMADHKIFTMTTGVAVYFCDPRSPWQRGTNENWNRLARQYFPKGADFSVHTQDDLDEAARKLNTRPRETLGWDTPTIRFNQLVAQSP